MKIPIYEELKHSIAKGLHVICDEKTPQARIKIWACYKPELGPLGAYAIIKQYTANNSQKKYTDMVLPKDFLENINSDNADKLINEAISKLEMDKCCKLAQHKSGTLIFEETAEDCSVCKGREKGQSFSS